MATIFYNIFNVNQLGKVGTIIVHADHQEEAEEVHAAMPMFVHADGNPQGYRIMRIPMEDQATEEESSLIFIGPDHIGPRRHTM